MVSDHESVGQDAVGSEEGQVKWYYAVDHRTGFESRNEAIGVAALINRDRDDRRSDVTVWAYPVCDCQTSIVTLEPGNYCGRCGEWIQ
jgi:hypothetical protein